MNALALTRNARQGYMTLLRRFATIKVSQDEHESLEIIDPPENLELATLNYEKRRNDPIEVKKARLIYQSRKRGMLENGILLSSFVAKYLSTLTDEQIDEYDKIINLPSNDWDIFNWAMGMKPTPEIFDNSVMNMLKEHIKHAGKDACIGQPPLGPK